MPVNLQKLRALGAARLPTVGPVSPPEEEGGSLVLDSLNAAGMGIGDLYGALGALTEYAAPDVGRTMQDQAGSTREWFAKNLSEDSRKSLEKEFFSLGTDSALRDPKAIWLNVARQVPNIAAMFIPGGVAAKGAQAIKLAERGVRIARTVGQGAGGAALGGGQAADEVGQELEKAGVTDPEARAEARAVATGIGALVGSVAIPVELGLIGKAFGRGASREAAAEAAAKQVGKRFGKARAMAGSGAKAAAVNAAEETGQQAGIELGKEQAGVPADWGNLPEAATAAAVTGAATVGAARIAGYGARPFMKRKLSDDARSSTEKLIERVESEQPEAPPEPVQTAPAPELQMPHTQMTLFGAMPEFSLQAQAAQELARRERAGQPLGTGGAPYQTPEGVRKHLKPHTGPMADFVQRANMAAAETAAVRARAEKKPADGLQNTALGEAADKAATAQVEAQRDFDLALETGVLPYNPTSAESTYKTWLAEKTKAQKAADEKAKIDKRAADNLAKEKAKLDKRAEAERLRAEKKAAASTSALPANAPGGENITGQAPGNVVGQPSTTATPVGQTEPPAPTGAVASPSAGEGVASSVATTAAPAPVLPTATPSEASPPTSRRRRRPVAAAPEQAAPLAQEVSKALPEAAPVVSSPAPPTDAVVPPAGAQRQKRVFKLVPEAPKRRKPVQPVQGALPLAAMATEPTAAVAVPSPEERVAGALGGDRKRARTFLALSGRSKLPTPEVAEAAKLGLEENFTPEELAAAEAAVGGVAPADNTPVYEQAKAALLKGGRAGLSAYFTNTLGLGVAERRAVLDQLQAEGLMDEDGNPIQPANSPVGEIADGSEAVITATGAVDRTLPPADQVTAGAPLAAQNAALGHLFRVIRTLPNGLALSDVLSDDILGRLPPEWRELQTRLMRSHTLSTRIYVRDFDDRVSAERGKAAFYDPRSNTITLDDSRIAPDFRYQMVLHEVAHAATERFLRQDTVQVRRAREDLANIISDLAKVFDAHAETFPEGSTDRGMQLLYAEQLRLLSQNPSEFIAAALSDPQFATVLRDARPFATSKSIWKRFLDWVAGAHNAFKAMPVLERLLEDATRFHATAATEPVMTASKLDNDAGPVGWSAFAAITAAGRYLNPSAAMAGIGSGRTHPGQAGQSVWSVNDAVKQGMFYDVIGTEHLGELYAPGLDAATKGVAGTAMLDYIRHNAEMAHDLKKRVETAMATILRFEELSRDQPEQSVAVSELMADTSQAQLFPYLPLHHADNATGALQPGAARRHAELQTRWSTLSPEAQALYRDLHDLGQNSFRDLIDHSLKAILTQAYRKVDPTTGTKRPEGFPLAQAEDDANRVFAAIHRSSDIDNIPHVSPRALKEMKRLYQSARVKGPYFPAMRPHDYFIVMGDPKWTTRTFTAAEWANNTDPALNVKNGSIKRNADGSYTAQVRRYWVETMPTEQQAYSRRGELETELGLKSGQIKLRDEYLGSLSSTTPDAAELNYLIDTATEGMSGPTATAVRNNLLELFASRSAEGSTVRSRTHREFVGGASRAITEAVALQTTMIGRQISRMIFDPRRQDAKASMTRAAKEIRGRNPKDALHIDRIIQTLNRRNELIEAASNDRALGANLLGQVTNFTATMFLTSPMTVITNGLQPWVVAVPAMAGRHGLAATSAALAKVTNQIAGHGMRHMWDAWSRAVRGRRALAPGATLHDRMLHGVSGLRRAMVDILVGRNQIDFTSTDDLLQVTDPRREGEQGRSMYRKVQEFLFVAPRMVETFNRLSVALTAYDLATAKGDTHEAAVEYASRMVRHTQFNYEQNNKSVLFLNPGLQAALVFKQYPYNMMYFYLREGYLALHGTGAQKSESRKTLGLFAATLFAGAGVMGAAPEPLWAAFASICKSLDLGPPDLVIREGVEAITGSKTLGVMAAKGPLSVLTGTDLQRIGISNMVLPRDLYDAEGPSDVGIAMLMGFLGAPGGLAESVLQGMERIGKGDVVGGAAAMIPLRIVSNVATAAHWAVNGYTDSTGKPVLTPEEIGLWGLGQKALGASPMHVAEVQSFRRASYLAERRSTEAKSDLYERWQNAATPAERASLRGEIRRYNADNPDSRITSKSLGAAMRERAKVERQLLEHKVPVPNAAAERRVNALSRFYNLPASAEG